MTEVWRAELVGVNRRVLMGSAAAYELFMFIDVTQTLNIGTGTSWGRFLEPHQILSTYT